MARKNWNYKTTRNRVENNFYKGFDNGADSKYNQKVLRKYKLNEYLISYIRFYLLPNKKMMLVV